jgi:KTSC domain-containing protein
MAKTPDWTGPGRTQMIPLSSSAIKAAGYDPGRRKMYIRFPGGEIYDFCNVPPDVFDGLINAPSPGTYYDRNVRGRYPCH